MNTRQEFRAGGVFRSHGCIGEVIKHFREILSYSSSVPTMDAMIKLRHQQPSLWAGILAAEIEDLWEPWMLVVDGLLEDEQLMDPLYEAQGRRYPQSRSRSRMQTPAEVVLRLLLKHVRNWSYETLERACSCHRSRYTSGSSDTYRAGYLPTLPGMGVKWVSVPNRNTKSAERRQLHKQRWFRRGATMADGLWGPHKRSQAKTWIAP